MVGPGQHVLAPAQLAEAFAHRHRMGEFLARMGDGLEIDHRHRGVAREGLDDEVFAIHWRGRNFVAAAGDNNYNSTGHDSAFYRSKRKYTELGLLRRTPIGGGVTFDAEARWHRIDDEESIAFFNTPWELSYRFIVRAPIDVVVRRR